VYVDRFFRRIEPSRLFEKASHNITEAGYDKNRKQSLNLAACIGNLKMAASFPDHDRNYPDNGGIDRSVVFSYHPLHIVFHVGKSFRNSLEQRQESRNFVAVVFVFFLKLRSQEVFLCMDDRIIGEQKERESDGIH